MITVLLPHGSTPKGFGLGHDDRKMYVLSKCCGQPVNFDTTRDEVNYKCMACSKVFPGKMINGPRNWLPEVYLQNFKAGEPGDEKKIKGWLYDWTGQADIEITVEGI